MVRLAPRITLGLLLFSSIGAWGMSPSPPQGELWEERPNGDAVQKDLGFIVPKRWEIFEREGFTSTRTDGANVKAYYVSDDKALRLGIMLMLRPDVRGLALDQDLTWLMVRATGEFEYARRTKSKPTELSTKAFSLGGRSPAGRERWIRVDMDSGGAEVQGLWWQNIGVWTVVITMSGPEERRADIEAQANTLLTNMPFPSAPLATELAVVGEKLFASLPKCKGKRPEGAGGEIVPTFKEAAALSLLMPVLTMGKANDSLISPVTGAKNYCVIETFFPRKDLPVTAIEYSGPATDAWEARYGFAINRGRGGYYQVERLPALKTRLDAVDAEHAYLNFSNNKRSSLVTVFDAWPSYEAAKQAVVALHKEQDAARLEPVISITSSAEMVHVRTNKSRIQAMDEAQPQQP